MWKIKLFQYVCVLFIRQLNDLCLLLFVYLFVCQCAFCVYVWYIFLCYNLFVRIGHAWIIFFSLEYYNIRKHLVYCWVTLGLSGYTRTCHPQQVSSERCPRCRMLWRHRCWSTQICAWINHFFVILV